MCFQGEIFHCCGETGTQEGRRRWKKSTTGLFPTFGDVPRKEKIIAQNGVLYDSEAEGLATYMVQLSVTFIKEFKTTDPWFM